MIKVVSGAFIPMALNRISGVCLSRSFTEFESNP